MEFTLGATVESRSFPKFSEASAFAKRRAQEGKRAPRVFRDGVVWVVESADSQDRLATRTTAREESTKSPISATPRGTLPVSPTIKRTMPAEVVDHKRGISTDSGISGRLKKEITEIEHRSDLSDNEKVARITHIACATCAGIAIQPIPFGDIFFLTPVQAYLGSRVAAIRGVPVSKSATSDVIKEIIGVIGMGIVAQQIGIGVWKIVTGGLGGLLTIPLVYGLTYAMMGVIDAYYSAKARNRKLSEKQIKDIWREAFAKGKEKGKSSDGVVKVK